MPNFTRDWIAQREQLEDAATEGPWHWEPPSGDDWPQHDESLVTKDGDAVLMGWGYDASGIDGDPADQAFIADARTALPAAVAALKAVLELHRLNREGDGNCQGYTSSGYGYLDRWCVECSDQSSREYGTPWPCPTVRAVEDVLRGES